jgi:glycosyltransferase involved in cell wall biosynthesis
MNKPLVTVGIPTYNRADGYLRYAIESVLNQSYDNIEIIISDNHSTDNTEELVRGYRDPRIRYVKQSKNIGPFMNMNYCLEKAQGTYFLMLHDDDSIDPEFISVCMKKVGYRHDAGIIITGSRIIDANGKITIEKANHCEDLNEYEFIVSWYEKKVHLFFCSILFNTEKLKKIGGFNQQYRYLIDAAAELEMIVRTRRVDVRDVLATFRAHNASFGKKSKIAQWCDDNIKVLLLACSLMEGEHDTKYLYRLGMKSSADRMYRYAVERVPNKVEKIKSFFVVWQKFGFRYLPREKYMLALFPALYYLHHPVNTLIKIHKKLIF